MKKKLVSAIMVMALSVATLVGCGSAGGASSDGASLPKNIEVQVPAKAGGGTDVMARTLGTEVAEQSGSNVNIVNNMDGNGVVAMETVRTATADGSKILQYHTSMLISTATGLYDYSAADDFKVIGVSEANDKAAYVLVTSADAPYQTISEFVEYGKSNEVKLGIQNSASTHIQTGLMVRETGINAKYVEAGSDTEKLTALVGGTIDACIVNVNQAKQYVESGKAVALAVISNGDEGARSSVLPDVPSFVDEGYDVTFSVVNIILGPKDMGDETAKAIYQLYADAAKADSVTEVLDAAGMGMTFLPYEDGPEFVKNQQEVINSLVEELGLAQ